jgi:hypothetical protein
MTSKMRSNIIGRGFFKRSGSTTVISRTDHGFDRPSGTGPLCIFTQALRARLLSCCPSGTKTIRPSKRLAATFLAKAIT